MPYQTIHKGAQDALKMMGRRRFYDQLLDDARDTVQTTALTEQDALTLKDFIHVRTRVVCTCLSCACRLNQRYLGSDRANLNCQCRYFHALIHDLDEKPG